jgi:serine protease Do
MRKVIAIAALFCVALASVAQAATNPPVLDSKSLVEKVKKGVIRVQTTDVREEAADTNPGGGSGFIFEIDYDKGIAYGITNHHVAGYASSVSVTTWNGTVYLGEMVAREPGIDVALIRVHGIPDERNLPDSQKTLIAEVLGDSDKVRPGDVGLAMGNPGTPDALGVNRSDPYANFLLNQTATLNVVTGRDSPLEFAIGIWQQNRSGGGDPHERLGWEYGTNLDYTFRMSTTINPGNSGGPLFNSKGEVIGINFYGGGSTITQNSNSAIPINLAKDFVNQVLNTGKFEKPWLGLDLIFPSNVESPDDYIEFRERYRPDKLEVFGVRRDSPADQAGIKRGDVIVDINGQHFKTPEDVRLWIFSQDIGTPLAIRVIRNGQLLPDPIHVNVGVKRTYDAEFSV